MKPLILALAFSIFTGNEIVVLRGKAQCRCLSTDSCWPSPSTFATLAAQVSQPLLTPLPPASVCYAPCTNCSQLQQLWGNGNWRSHQPGAMQAPNWESFIFPNGSISACYINNTLGVPCQQGSVSVLGVDARTVKDVQATVQFAASQNLRLLVKNTGHDYLGRSSARGSLLLWTHHMKNITFHNTFTPDGAPKTVVYNQVISLGAGVQWHEAYDAVHAHGRVIVGGLSPGGSVGAAGGWLQGGGHSALSPKYGLGVDNAIEIAVVTSSGAYLITNQFQNSDLFWALRGGGGGTYGIVTSVTYQTHPSTPLIAAFFSTHINTPVNNASDSTPSPVLNQLFTEFVRVTPALSDGGWSGYATIVPGPPTNAPSLRFFYIAPDISWEVANATLNLFFAFAQNLSAHSSVENGGALSIDVATSFPVDSFYSLYELIFTNETGQVGAPVEIASRLLPRKLIEDDYHKVADTILSLPFPDFFLLGGGAVSKVKPSSAGLNPAWREALIHTVVASTWQEGASADEINGALNNLKQYVTTLHDLAPSSGAYFNEASLYEINPQYTFFGDHYHKLEAIKAKYDPIDLFVVAEGVGSNKWDRSLTCRT